MKGKIFVLLGLIVGFSCSRISNTENSETMHEYTNELINESSPYLLQHAHNPVNWYPWGEEALKKAQEEDKLLIISIGYAACHWCHVMEHESFEDTTVAQLMNEKYVSIKIDREERPDVDQVYMNAAQIYLNGGGGWPLNAIALPDGRPIFAGTYFQKKAWMEILEKVDEFYRQSPEKAEQQASALTEGIKSIDVVELAASESELTQEMSSTAFQNMLSRVDLKEGGQKGAPKFPMPVSFDFMLRYHQLYQSEEALQAVKVTLDKMAMGGIYDQLGGGFARYSTDGLWKVPHFEKMLYDNAQLVSLYSSAYQLTKDPLYQSVVYETLEFIERELTSPEGGFYSSLDADSEGEEGKFYIWDKAEIDQALGTDAELFNTYYNVSAEGNWEEKNILIRKKSLEDFALENGLSKEEWASQLDQSKKKLFAVREEKIRPGLDDKVLTSWNALMIKGYATAYRVFKEPKFLDAAIRNAEFIVNQQWKPDGSLYRNYKDGKSAINAFMDDYALTIEAFIHLYQATFDEKWLAHAKKLADYADQHFFDEKTGMYFYTSDEDPALIARKMEISDNVIPSSNSVMALNLYMLGELFYEESLIEKSKQMLYNVKEDMVNERTSFYYSNWNTLLTWFNQTPYEIAIVGDNFQEQRQLMDEQYLPNSLFMGGKNEGTLPLLENKFREGYTMIYVCQNKSCKLPVQTADQALNLIQ